MKLIDSAGACKVLLPTTKRGSNFGEGGRIEDAKAGTEFVRIGEVSGEGNDPALEKPIIKGTQPVGEGGDAITGDEPTRNLLDDDGSSV